MKNLLIILVFILSFNFAFSQTKPNEERPSIAEYAKQQREINDQNEILKDQIEEKDLWYFDNWFTHFFINHEGEIVLKGKVKELLKDIPLARYDFGKFSEGLAYFRVNKDYGYMDTAFNVVIAPKYSRAEDFKDGTARVFKGKNDFIIDTKGEKVRNYKYHENETTEISVNHPNFYAEKKVNGYEVTLFDRNGKGAVAGKYQELKPYKESMMAVKQEGKWGFLDYAGNMAIQPQYDDVEDFSEGLAAVCNVKKEKGFINKKGEVVIPLKYEWDNNFVYNKSPDGFKIPPNSFCEGITVVKLNNGTYEFIDKTGTTVAMRDDIKYSYNFHNGIAVVKLKNDSKLALIRQDGSLISTIRYHDIVPMEEAYLWVKEEDNGLWKLINTKGESNDVRSFNLPESVDEEIVRVNTSAKGEYYYQGIDGNMITKTSFKEADPFKYGMARVRYVTEPEKYHDKLNKAQLDRFIEMVKGTPEEIAARERNAEIRAKQCDACSGTGMTGGGTLQCSSCGGNGGTPCGSCGGGGRMYNYKGESQNCTSCYGSGKKICYTCMGSGKKHATGTKCSKCNGTGLK